jgi:hypothetical protein
MKRTLYLITLAAMLAIPALAQSSISCTNLEYLHETVCRTTVGDHTVYSSGEVDADHAAAKTITEEEYNAAMAADLAAVQEHIALLHKANVIASYGRRYGQKHWDCDQVGGKWSDVRHTCKVSK